LHAAAGGFPGAIDRHRRASAADTRPRRRAEPAEATAVYGTVEQSPRVLRPTLLRSL